MSDTRSMVTRAGLDRRSESDALATCYRAVSERIEHTIHTSELGVARASREVTGVVALAERQARDLERLCENLDGGGLRDAAPGDELGATARALTACVESGALAQGADADRARALVADIERCAAEIGGVFSSMMLLNVSMRIAAAHLGVTGRSVNVIAEQIRQVSLAIKAANESITALVSTLSSHLQQIGGDARETRSLAMAFGGELDAQSSAARAAVVSLRGSMTSALAASRARTGEVITMSREAITALKCHDGTGASLRQLVTQLEEIGARHDVSLSPSTLASSLDGEPARQADAARSA